MSQDLDQILLLIGSVLGGGFALLLLLARLEPNRTDAMAQALLTPDVPLPVADLPPVVTLERGA
jgi:hypothetical protein